MAVVPTKRPKASAVKQASIKDTNAFLQSLPEKPKEDLSLREAVDQMRDSVRGALAKGYTYQELAAMLTEKGIKISAFTLKNYVPSGRRRSSKEQAEKTILKRGRRAKAAPGEVVPAPIATSKDASATNTKNGSASAAEASKVSSKTLSGRGKSATAAKTKTGTEATVKQPTVQRRSSTAAKTASKPATSSAKAPKGRKKA